MVTSSPVELSSSAMIGPNVLKTTLNATSQDLMTRSAPVSYRTMWGFLAKGND